MIERLSDFVAHLYIGERIAGYHTKIGALCTTLLALSAVLIQLVTALRALDDGHYHAALAALTGPEMLAGLSGLGLTKIFLGLRRAIQEHMQTLEDAKPAPQLIVKP